MNQDIRDDLEVEDAGSVLCAATDAGEGVCRIPRATFGTPSSATGVMGRAVEAAVRLTVRPVGGIVECGVGSMGVLSFVTIDAGTDAGRDAGVRGPPWTVGVAVPVSWGELKAGVTGRETLVAFFARSEPSDSSVAPEDDSGVGKSGDGSACAGGEKRGVRLALILFV